MNQAIQYDFLDQKRVIIGTPFVDAVAEEVADYGAKRVLVVSSRTLHRKLSVTDALADKLGVRLLEIYDDIAPHAPLESVLLLVKAIKRLTPDIIVSLGGGSVIDTVKVAALAHAAKVESVKEIAALRVTLNEQGEQVSPFVPDSILRQIAVPTTLSGAEFGTIGGAVDTERKVKDIYAHPQMCSQSIIYDPELCRQTPNDLWVATAMRAVDHAVETILSRKANPFTDGPALNALKLFGRSLKAGDQMTMSLDAIEECQYAVWAATIGLMRTPYGASHGIGHQVGAVAGVQHGICSCVLLPAVLQYNSQASGERGNWIAEALGSPDLTASEAVKGLIHSLKLPDSLSKAGVLREQLPVIASAAFPSYFVQNNLRPITDPSQVLDILELAWD